MTAPALHLQPKANTLRTRYALLTPAQQELAAAHVEQGLDSGLGVDAAWRRALAAAELPVVPADVPVLELTVRVQTDTCARCGGTGHYSFNLMDGTRCYGCNGRGTVATKLGRTALAALDGWRDTEGAKLPGDLQPGDRYMSRRMNGTWVPRTVTEVQDSSPVRVTQGSAPTVVQPMVTLVSAITMGGRPATHADTVYADKPVRLPLAGDLWAAYVAFAATVPGVVIERRAVQA